MIGSGVAGLTAALSAARGRGASAARDQARARVLQHGQGAGRHPGGTRRRTTRPPCTPRTSCTARTRPPIPVSSPRSPPRRPPRSSAWSGSASPSRTTATAATASRAVAVRRASGCCRWAIARATPSPPRCAAPSPPTTASRRSTTRRCWRSIPCRRAGARRSGGATARASRSLPARSCWPPAAAASPRPSGSARSPPTPPAPPAR